MTGEGDSRVAPRVGGVAATTAAAIVCAITAIVVIAAATIVATTTSKTQDLLVAATTTATARAAPMTLLVLWVLDHTRGGLVPNNVAEHVGLPLQHVDGPVGVAEGILGQSTYHAEIGDDIGHQCG